MATSENPPENRWTKLRKQLYAMPPEELRRLALSYFDISVSETGVWSILPPAKGTISPEEEFTIQTWANRDLADRGGVDAEDY